MPKPRKRVSTGMSVSDVLKMPISQLENYDLAGIREITSRLASAGNKRLKTLEKNNIENSAVLRVQFSGGKFSVKGKGKEETIKEFIRARDFLKNKFSKASEWKKTVKNISKKVEQFKGIKETDVSQAFAMYDYLREIEPEIVNKVNKYDLQSYIVNLYMDDKDTNKIMNKAVGWAKRQYEEQQKRYKEQSTKFASNIDYDIPVRLRTKRRKKRKR